MPLLPGIIGRLKGERRVRGRYDVALAGPVQQCRHGGIRRRAGRGRRAVLTGACTTGGPAQVCVPAPAYNVSHAAEGTVCTPCTVACGTHDTEDTDSADGADGIQTRSCNDPSQRRGIPGAVRHVPQENETQDCKAREHAQNKEADCRDAA